LLRAKQECHREIHNRELLQQLLFYQCSSHPDASATAAVAITDSSCRSCDTAAAMYSCRRFAIVIVFKIDTLKSEDAAEADCHIIMQLLAAAAYLKTTAAAVVGDSCGYDVTASSSSSTWFEIC